MTNSTEKHIEWYVYVNGKYVGTVCEKGEDNARCAAYCKFDLGDEDELSVNKVQGR